MTREGVEKFNGRWVRLIYGENKNVGEIKGTFREFIVFDIGGEMEVTIPYKRIDRVELLRTRKLFNGHNRNLYNIIRRKRK
jgi:ribosome maturation factor RimP